MSIPSTLDDPRFITRRPAWEKGADLTQTLDTGLFRARAGLEQSQRRRARAQWALSYSVILTRAELAARDLEAAGDAQAGLVVPFWTEMATTITTISLQIVQIDRPPDSDWFVPGDWVFFSSPTQGEQFRQIDALYGSVAMGFTDSGLTDFTAGTKIFPCRRCVMDTGRIDWSPDGPDTGAETLKFVTL